VEWKFAKYNYCLGKQTTDEKESEKAFEYGKQAGRIASRVEPNKPDGHFWYGANLGEQARRSPVTVGIKALDDIRAAMNRVIEIEPRYQGASAFDALAQVELSTTGMMGGKPEKAVEYLEKALELEQNNTYIFLHLAQAYSAVGRKADARRQLDHLLSMKPDPDWIFEYKESIAKAKRMLDSKS
jgi:tetratricopeptide (TPR) repeat protein